MAIQFIGQLSINLRDPVPNPYPTVNLQSGVGYVFLLETDPPLQLIDYAYFVISPFIEIAGLTYEISCRQKWYPKQARFSFVVPVYDAGGANLDVGVALIPIEIFKGRAQPAIIDVELSYEDSLIQPLGFGI